MTFRQIWKQQPILWLLFLLLFALLVAPNVWQQIKRSPQARDYATYHYAVRTAQKGHSPYDTPRLVQESLADSHQRSSVRVGQWTKISKGRFGQIEEILSSQEVVQTGIEVRLANQEVGHLVARQRIHPYFYPPPALLGMIWAPSLRLIDAYMLFCLANLMAWFGSLWILARWVQLNPLWLALLGLTFSPALCSTIMGQVNGLVLFLLLLGLWRTNGWLLGSAAMIKMSPAILLLPYGMWKNWRMLATSVVTAMTLSIIGLVLIDAPTQWHFYRHILPQFSSGNYAGLTVAINFDGNHSLPDLFNRLFPHSDMMLENRQLSPWARTGSGLFSLGALATLAGVSHRTTDSFGRQCVLAATVALMIITPVYTYEHHLIFAAVPIAVVIKAFQLRRLPWRWLPLAVLCYGALAWDWDQLRTIFYGAEARGDKVLASFVREGKFMGCLFLGLLCLMATQTSHQNET